MCGRGKWRRISAVEGKTVSGFLSLFLQTGANPRTCQSAKLKKNEHEQQRVPGGLGSPAHGDDQRNDEELDDDGGAFVFGPHGFAARSGPSARPLRMITRR